MTLTTKTATWLSTTLATLLLSLLVWLVQVERGRLGAMEAKIEERLPAQATDIAVIKTQIDHVRWQQEYQSKRLDEMTHALEAAKQVLEAIDRKVDRLDRGQRFSIVPPGPGPQPPQAPGGR